jgi:hypothetical protein
LLLLEELLSEDWLLLLELLELLFELEEEL